MKFVRHRPALFVLFAFIMSLSPSQWLLGQPESAPTKNKTASAAQGTDAGKGTIESKLETATFGGGCFWCVEAVYQRVDGVKNVVSGYTGGNVPNPTYEAVCTGRTGHAEVCQITFDPSKVTYEELLIIFFKTHDPTSLNKQGADEGTQYRSVVYYEDEAQRLAAEKIKAKLLEEKVYKKIVTEISPIADFYPAEAYHQNYFVLHPQAQYCRNVINEKVAKFEKLFKENSKLQKEREAKKSKTK
jgi:peptide-methionine (S)-S-oxide reductase